MIHVEGAKQLESRLRAVQHVPDTLMRTLALTAVREQKLLVPRKTGNLGRTIHVERLMRESALTVASATYASHVEYGTKPHVIKPVKAKALRFAGRGTPTTLAGRVRSGSANKPGAFAFAKIVHHPGTKAQPFMLPGAEKAIATTVGADAIVKAWNRAA